MYVSVCEANAHTVEPQEARVPPTSSSCQCPSSFLRPAGQCLMPCTLALASLTLLPPSFFVCQGYRDAGGTLEDKARALDAAFAQSFLPPSAGGGRGNETSQDVSGLFDEVVL